MAMTRSIGTYLLQSKHGPALASLAAGTTDDPGSLARELREHGAAAFVAARVADRQEGTRHTFAIEDRGQLLGLSTLRVRDDGRGEADVWVGAPFRRRGHATFALGMLLEFAFTNLRLALVEAMAPDGDGAGPRLLARQGLQAQPKDTSANPGQRYAISEGMWRARRDAPALAGLVPGLKTILDAELAAGNEIVETSTGWPDSDSVLVRLRRPLMTNHALPQGVRYAELHDPHWWKAEYASESPRQLVVH